MITLRTLVVAFLVLSSGLSVVSAMDAHPSGGRDGDHHRQNKMRYRTKSTSSISFTLSDDLDLFLTEENFDFDKLVEVLNGKMLESKKKIEIKDLEALVTEHLCGLCATGFTDDNVAVAKERFLSAVQAMRYELIK